MRNDDLFAPFRRRDACGPMGCHLPLRLKLLILAQLPFAVARALLALLLLTSFSACCLLLCSFPESTQAALLPPLAAIHARSALLCFGVWLRAVGTPARSAAVLVSNHVSWADILAHVALSAPGFVAKESLSRVFLVGAAARCLRCIFVAREAKAGGAATQVLERLQRAVPGQRPLVLFPEGTTSNGCYLLPFRTGAFIAGCPVQPVLLSYAYGAFSPAWETITFARHSLFMLCSWRIRLTVTYLPLHTPSEAERADAKLFAANVREELLRAGDLRPSAAGLAEKRAFQEELLAEWAKR